MSAKARFLNRIALSTSLLILLYAEVAFSGTSWETWQDKSGPIPLVNQCPIQLLFLQPVPDRAETLPKGHGSIRLNTTVTNTLVSKEESAHYEATVDMETIRTSFEVCYGVLPGLELGFALPVSHFYSGFMDRPIKDVEEAFGKTRSIRAQQQANEFSYSVKKDGKVIISGSEDSTGIGDLVLRAKARVLDQVDTLPAISARGSVKLPTGREGRAFGSGEPDWGFGLLFEKDVKRLSLYFNADVTFPGEAFDDVGLSLKEFYTLLLGVEYVFSPRFSILSQMYYLTRPFEHTGVEVLDRRICELLIGLNYQTRGKIFVQAGCVEDIFDSCDATADVTLFMNLGMNF